MVFLEDAWKAFNVHINKDLNPEEWKDKLENELPPNAQMQTVKHHPALDYRDMERCISELKKKSRISARTLEFLILTARQTGEVIGARRE
jgi:hypothetical protein